MAKIVIIAPAEATSDVDDAAKMLRGNGHDVDIEQPVPKNLLHIVLGLLGPNAYGFGPGYAYAPGPDADAADGDDEEAIEGDVTADPDAGVEDELDFDGSADIEIPDGGDDFNFEGVTVDGEPIKATKTDADTSVLMVSELYVGPKTTYKLNESKYSFWPSDPSAPMQRVDVGASRGHTSLEVAIVGTDDTPELKVGKDLYDILGIKPETKTE